MEPTAAPLITSAQLGIVTTFGDQLLSAIPIVLAVIIPVSLSVWILPTVISKAIGILKSAFNKIKA